MKQNVEVASLLLEIIFQPLVKNPQEMHCKMIIHNILTDFIKRHVIYRFYGEQKALQQTVYYNVEFYKLCNEWIKIDVLEMTNRFVQFSN